MTRGAEPDRRGRTGGPYRRRVVAVMLLVGMALLAQACAGSSDNGVRDGPDCGEALAKAGGGHWTCTFADDFRGDRLDPRKWLIQSTALTGFRNNQECYGNDDNVVVSGGVLRLTVRREAAPFDQPFIIALTQSLGVAATANQFDATTPLPATMQVDRVRVWK